MRGIFLRRSRATGQEKRGGKASKYQIFIHLQQVWRKDKQPTPESAVGSFSIFQDNKLPGMLLLIKWKRIFGELANFR
jgi:hypothetical protein